MTEKEINIINNSIERTWGDWEYTLKVMDENNLKILSDEIITSNGSHIFSIDCGYYSEEFVELLQLAYELYKKVNHSPSTYSGKSKYMKLC